jgi:iron complex outermembrane receptor protein
MRFFIFLSASLLTALSSLAQEKEIELDPITVTATLSPLTISKTGRNIIVIKGDQINKLPVNSIDELIRFLPGIEVQSRGPMGVQSNITIRGGTFQQVLIILDGIRLNDPLTGHFNSYFPISPSEIDHIEIMKGASSAIYGTEAVGGVVHIISKTFAAKTGKDGFKINSQITAGEFGLFNSQVGGFIHKKKTTASIGFISNNAKGQQLRGTKGFFNLSTFSASVKQELAKNMSIAYRFGYDDRNFSAQNFYTQFTSDTATESVLSNWHHVKLEYKKDKQRLSLDIGNKNTRDHYLFRKGLNPNVNNSDMLQALLVHDYTLSKKANLISGAQFIQRKIISNDRGNHQVNAAGLFLLLNQNVNDFLQLNPAIRVDWNERGGWEFVPQLNASFKYEQIQFRGNVGRTTRTADFTELFNNYQRSNVPSGSRVGNVDLRAESSISYEVGADYFITSNLKISTSWYERFHRKSIDWILTTYANMPRKENLASGGTFYLAENISKVNISGVELDIAYQKTFSQNHFLSANAGFFWMRSFSSDSAISLYVSNHAKELFNFSANYRFKQLGIGLNGLYKSRNPQSGNPVLVPLSIDYFLLNLRTDVYFFNDKLAAYIQADNLLDKKYTDIFGPVMPGRWLMGGLKITLQ